MTSQLLAELALSEGCACDEARIFPRSRWGAARAVSMWENCAWPPPCAPGSAATLGLGSAAMAGKVRATSLE